MTQLGGASVRTLIAVDSAKLIGLACRRIGRSGGTAAPGLVAARIDPQIVQKLARQCGRGCVLVTGTNGKTTTSRLLAGMAQSAGWRVVHNRSGSNLMRGIATTLVSAAGAGCGLPGDQTLGVLEVDEATLPEAAQALQPRAIVFTNLFRDQLDRYGEVDSIGALWSGAVKRLDPVAQLVLNADDPSVASLATGFVGSVWYYGVEDRRLSASAEHAADARWCAACGAGYRYEALYYAHLGLWQCPGCGASRPLPATRALSITSTAPDTTSIALELPGGPLNLTASLSGLYNAYNVVAAVAGAAAIGLSREAVRDGVARFRPAFGRQERLQVGGREVRVLLCKNPAGVNQVIRTLAATPGTKHLLVMLNDGIADGRDVSWIWDVDFELLCGQTGFALASGTRAADLALRLKYAGLGDLLACESDQRKALRRALAATPSGGCLYVLPTYTAMLAVREQLAQLGHRSHFWQQ